MPKLSDREVEGLLVAYLEKSKGMPLEELLRRAIPWESLDVLQGEHALKELRERGLVESNGGWWRLSDDEREERKPKGIAGLFRKK